MRILVKNNLDVVLVEADNFNEFDLCVEPGTDRSSLAPALRGIADPEGDDHAWVHEAWLLQQLPRLATAAGWRASFDAMSRYAQKKGWTRDDPDAIRAHIVSGG
jgi:hypothetical protein